MTPLAVASLASLVDTETVAVKLETFGLFAIAEYFFAQSIGLCDGKLFHEFFLVTETFCDKTLSLGSGVKLLFVIDG